MKLLCVPTSEEAMFRLGFNENIDGDLIELILPQDEYEVLVNLGYFGQLNKQLNLMIDDYEDEKILFDDLNVLLCITNIFAIKNRDECKLWPDLIRLISVATEKKTGVFLFF